MSDEIILDHRETHLNMMASDHDEWSVFTDDPYWIRRLDRIAVGVSVANGEGKQYTLRADQVLIRAKKREVSAENRLKFAERMRKSNPRLTPEKSPIG